MDGVNTGANRHHTRLLLVALVLVAVALGWFAGRCHSGEAAVTGDTARVVVIDTIPYYKPVPRDSVVVRYVTKLAKLAGAAADAAVTVADGGGVAGVGAVADATVTVAGDIASDSVAVEIPITQKEYIGDEYRAYISGYMPSLDSIFVYGKTITETVIPADKRRTRWHERFGFGVGVGAGYGIIHKQADIFVGGVVSFKVWP